MNRKLTKRELWLLSSAPVILGLIIYIFGVYRPMKVRLLSAERRIAAARDLDISPSLVAARGKLLLALQTRLAEKKHEMASVSSSRLLPASPLLSIREESVGMARVAEVLREHGGVVLQSTRLSESDANRLLMPEVADSISRVLGPATTLVHGVWSIEFVGSYLGVRDSLKAIGDLDMLVLPLSISMDPMEVEGNENHWRLWIWI